MATSSKKSTAPTVQVHDPEVDAPRRYGLRTMTRSAKRELREALRELNDFQEEMPKETIVDEHGEKVEVVDSLAVTDEQEDRATRLMCDVINAGVEEVSGITPAGDLLYQGWINDDEKVTDDEIVEAFETVTQRAKAATPPT